MADDRAQVLEAFNALEGAFDRLDIDAVLACCSEDVVFIGSGSGEEAVGKESLRNMFDALESRAAVASFAVRWETVEVDVRGDLALLTALGLGSLTSDRRVASMRYRLTGVLVRSDRGWLWREYHGSEPADW